MTMRSLCDWRALRLRVRDAPDCVVTQYPEDAEILQAWMQKLGWSIGASAWRAPPPRFFSTSSKRGAWTPAGAGTIFWRSRATCASFAPPPSSWACVSSTTWSPCTRPWRARSKYCRPCAWSATARRRCWSPPERPVWRAASAAASTRPTAGAGLQAGEVCDPERVCWGVDVVRCRKNALANATFPLPVFSPLDSVEREGHLADLTYVDLHCDDRQALLRKLPYLGRGWYSKPAAAYLLETNQATWSDFKRSLDATAHVEPRCLAQVLQTMEDAWPEGEEHMAKAQRQCAHRALGPEPGPGLQHAHQQPRAGRPWLPVAPDLHGRRRQGALGSHLRHGALQQLHTAAPPRLRHGAGARGRRQDPPPPPAGAPTLRRRAQDGLPCVFQDLPKKFLPAVRELTARKHPDGTPVYRFEECKYPEPRIEAPYLDWPPRW